MVFDVTKKEEQDNYVLCNYYQTLIFTTLCLHRAAEHIIMAQGILFLIQSFFSLVGQQTMCFFLLKLYEYVYFYSNKCISLLLEKFSSFWEYNCESFN